MPSTRANGITLEYESIGDPGRPVLLLIAGLGAQLISWDDELVKMLVDRDFRAIRYDNRDVGRSTWFDDAGVPNALDVLSGAARAPYVIADMADDAAGLLKALGISQAHVVGVSMGGMIAQSLAIRHPDMVATLTSIMSTTGDPAVGAPRDDAVQVLLADPPTDRDGAIATALAGWRVVGSPAYPADEARLAAAAAAAYDRAWHPEGTARQLVAVLASPDRTPELRRLRVPTLVVHGDADPLIDPSGGEATARAVPGAELWMLPGVGHDLPSQLFTDLADRLAAHCGR
jgi:pimeloyl-ACP methyl ester carboxylesterase